MTAKRCVMYYESYRKKPKRRRQRRSFGEWLLQSLLKLIALILIVAILCAAVMYALPPMFFAVEPEGSDEPVTGDDTSLFPLYVALFISGGLLLALAIVIAVRRRKSKKEETR